MTPQSREGRRPKSAKRLKDKQSRFEAFGQHYVIRPKSKQKQQREQHKKTPTERKKSELNVYERLDVLCNELSLPKEHREVLAQHHGVDEDGTMRQLDCLLTHRAMTIAALRFIHVRERAVNVIQSCVVSYTNLKASITSDHAAESQVSVDQRFMAGLADARDASYEVVQTIGNWALNLPPSMPAVFVWKEQDYLRKMSSDVSSIIQMNQNCLEALCRLGLHLEDLLLLVFSDDYPNSVAGTINLRAHRKHKYWCRRDGVESTFSPSGDDFDRWIIALQRAESIVRGLAPSWETNLYPSSPNQEYQDTRAPEENGQESEPQDSSWNEGRSGKHPEHYSEWLLLEQNPLVKWHHHTSTLLAEYGVPHHHRESLASQVVSILTSELNSVRENSSDGLAWWNSAVAEDLQERLRIHWLSRFVFSLSSLSSRRRVATAWRIWITFDRQSWRSVVKKTKAADEELHRHLKSQWLTRFVNAMSRISFSRCLESAWRRWIRVDQMLQGEITRISAEQKQMSRRNEWLERFVSAFTRRSTHRSIVAAWRVWIQVDRRGWKETIETEKAEVQKAQELFEERSNHEKAVAKEFQQRLRHQWLGRFASALHRIATQRILTKAWRIWIRVDLSMQGAVQVTNKVEVIVAEKTSLLRNEYDAKITTLEDSHRNEQAEASRWHEEIQMELSEQIQGFEGRLDGQSEMYIRATLRASMDRVMRRLEQAWKTWMAIVIDMRHAEHIEIQKWNDKIQREIIVEQREKSKVTVASALVRITKGRIMMAWMQWKAVSEANAMSAAEEKNLRSVERRLNDDYTASIDFLKERLAERTAAEGALRIELEQLKAKHSALLALSEGETQTELADLYTTTELPRQKSALRRVFRAIGGGRSAAVAVILGEASPRLGD